MLGRGEGLCESVIIVCVCDVCFKVHAYVSCACMRGVLEHVFADLIPSDLEEIG